MPVSLNAMEKCALQRFNLGPGPMLDLLNALACKAVITGLKLGVFDAIGKQRLTAREAAEALQCDPRGLEILLEALASVGYLSLKNGRFANTAMVKKWLLKGGEYNLGEMFFQFEDMLKRWDYLDESIRHGRPPQLGWEWLNGHPGSWERYHAGLGSTAKILMKEIVAKTRLPKHAKKILDLGGSHGMYSILFCKSHPSVSATVLDWPSAREVAEKNIADEGMQERVRFEPGDFVTDELQPGYDVFLLFNIIRIYQPSMLQELLKKFAGALEDGGMVIIMDHLGGSPSSDFVKANTELILLELYNSTLGITHEASDIMAWLAGAGFTSIKKIPLFRSPGLSVITGIKKS